MVEPIPEADLPQNLQDFEVLQEQITLLQALARACLEKKGDDPRAHDLKDAIANNIRKAQAGIGNERAGKGETQTNLDYAVKHFQRAAELGLRLKQYCQLIEVA